MFECLRPAALALVLLAVTVCASRVEAQSEQDLATRRLLVERAQTARAANRHAEALDLARRAARVRMTASLRLFIAQEQRAVGDVAGAFANADRCMRDADSDSETAHREIVKRVCTALAEELRPRLARIVVRIHGGGAASARVSAAGHDVPRSLWGVPYAVSPGWIVVEAAAAGRAPVRARVHVDAGDERPIDLDVGPASPLAGRSPPSAPPARRGEAGPGAWPWVLLGTGAAITAASGIFLALWDSEISDCPGDHCPDQATIDRVYAYGVTTYVLAGVGVAAIGAAIFWLLTSGGEDAP